MLWQLPSSFGGRKGQQAGYCSPADIVDPGKHDVVALDFHHDRRGQALAVKLTKRHREVRSIAVPADREGWAKRDVSRALRTAYRNFPFSSVRSGFLPVGEFLTQAFGSLLEG